MERAVGTLHANELFLVDGFVDRALALQRHSIVVDVKLDVVLIYFGELGLENEPLFGFVETHGGGPCPCGRELPVLCQNSPLLK